MKNEKRKKKEARWGQEAGRTEFNEGKGRNGWKEDANAEEEEEEEEEEGYGGYPILCRRAKRSTGEPMG